MCMLSVDLLVLGLSMCLLCVIFSCVFYVILFMNDDFFDRKDGLSEVIYEICVCVVLFIV